MDQIWDDLDEMITTQTMAADSGTESDETSRRNRRQLLLHGRGLLEGVELTPLSDADSILMASSHKHGHKKKKKHKKRKHGDDASTTMQVNLAINDGAQQALRFPLVGTPDQYHYQIPFALDESMEGRELDLKRAKKSDRSTKHVTVEPDPFATSLNWATTNNPDGVPLVHDVFDQVS